MVRWPEVVQEGQAVLQTPPATTSTQAPTQPRGRTAERHTWFVVEADTRDGRAPVAVLSRHTSQRAAKAALVKGLSRRSTTDTAVVLEVRSAEQIVARLEWDAETRAGVVRPGPPGA